MALITTVLHALSIAIGVVLLSRIFRRESRVPLPDRPKRFFGGVQFKLHYTIGLPWIVPITCEDAC